MAKKISARKSKLPPLSKLKSRSSGSSSRQFQVLKNTLGPNRARLRAQAVSKARGLVREMNLQSVGRPKRRGKGRAR